MAGEPDYRPIYGTLDPSQRQIRLVRLQILDNTEVHCSFSVASLLAQKQPQYAALSYTWGDPQQTEEIFVEKQPFRATSNLVAFLRRYWRSGNALDASVVPLKLLWIDAICINQSDDVEKSSQVGMMGHIYRSSAVTFAWLGANDEMIIGDALVRLGRVHDAIVKAQRRPIRTWLSQAVRRVQAARSDRQFLRSMRPREDANNDPAMDHLLELFLAPYFKRVCIFQELVLSPHVVFVNGGHTVTLDKVMVVMHQALQRVSGLQPKGIDDASWRALVIYSVQATELQMIIKTRKLLRDSKQTSLTSFDATFEIFLNMSRYRATEPVDKIFGVLGILGFPIVPDYSLPASDIFIAFAEHAVSHGRVGDILEHARPSLPADLNLPSWVPDWHSCWTLRPCITASDIVSNSSSACVKGKHLHAKGRQICRIKGTTGELGNDTSNVSQFYSGMNPSYVTGGVPSFRALLETLAVEETWASSSTLGALFTTLLVVAEAHVPLDESLRSFGFQDKDKPNFLGSFLDAVYPPKETTQRSQDMEKLRTKSFMDYYRLLRTQQYQWMLASEQVVINSGLALMSLSNGFVGLGAPQARQGDLLCVVHGFHHYAILREEDGIFTYIGPCYVKGLEHHADFDRPDVEFEIH